MRTVDFVFIAAMATVKKRKIYSKSHVLINSGQTVSWLITIIKLCALFVVRLMRFQRNLISKDIMIQSTKVNLIFNRLTLRRTNLLTAERIFYQGNATKLSKASSDRKTPRLSVWLARFGWFALMYLPSCTLLTFLIVVYLPYYINLLMASL